MALRRILTQMQDENGIEKMQKKKERGNQNANKRQRNHAWKTEEINAAACLLLCLPMHLVFDILARLPILSIFNCKCVCKTFLEILRDPYFTESHLKKSPKNDYSLVIQNKVSPYNILLAPTVDLDKKSSSSKTDDDGDYISWQTLAGPGSLPDPDSDYLTACLIGSCNGLLCLKYLSLGCGRVVFYVCNPILGEFMILPQPMPDLNQPSGFGFCPNSNQYKVIRFLKISNSCEILTLGTDHWRRIDAPCPANDWSFDSSFKGNLHWIVEGYNTMATLICSFNLETEKYIYISAPSRFSTNLCRRMTFHYIGTLDGLFCISYLLDRVRFEVWVMEDYGVKESWVKKISINLGYYWRYQEGIAFLDNGVLVLKPSQTSLSYYNTRTGTTRTMMFDGCYDAMPHAPSFISLKDIMRRKKFEKVPQKMLRVPSVCK